MSSASGGRDETGNPGNGPELSGRGQTDGPKVRAAGLDYGAARIGLAVADELGFLAHPRPFLDAKRLPAVFRELRRLVTEEGVGCFIVGLPRNMDGSEGLSAKRARRFAGELERRLQVPVELIDERLTTVEAQARLHEQGLDARRSKSRIDSASAAILLQSWLDRRRDHS